MIDRVLHHLYQFHLLACVFWQMHCLRIQKGFENVQDGITGNLCRCLQVLSSNNGLSQTGPVHDHEDLLLRLELFFNAALDLTHRFPFQDLDPLLKLNFMPVLLLLLGYALQDHMVGLEDFLPVVLSHLLGSLA